MSELDDLINRARTEAVTAKWPPIVDRVPVSQKRYDEIERLGAIRIVDGDAYFFDVIVFVPKTNESKKR